MVGETRDPAPLLVTAGAGCPMSWVRGSCPGLSPKLGTTKGSAPGVTTWVSFLVVRVGRGSSTGLEYAPFPPVWLVWTSHRVHQSQPVDGGDGPQGLVHRVNPAVVAPVALGAVPVVDLHQGGVDQAGSPFARDGPERFGG